MTSAPTSTDDLTVSAMIRSWAAADVLRAEDAKLGAAGFNQRLKKAGYLTGSTANWKPSAAAEKIGVFTIPGGDDQSQWIAIRYSAAAQNTLRKLYEEGKL